MKNSESSKSEMCCGMGQRKAFYPLILIILLGIVINACEKNQFNDNIVSDTPQITGISVMYPANLSESAFLDDAVSVTFRTGTAPAVVASTRITLNYGTIPVSGTVRFSGLKATFKSSKDLEPDKEYVASADIITGDKDGKHLEYTWRFKTGNQHGYQTLSVASVSPADKTADAPVASPLIVTFNKDLPDSLKNLISVTLSSGSKNVSGAASIAGKTLTFKPASTLTAATQYNAKVVIGAPAGSGTPQAKTFSWTFKTAGGGGTGGGTTDTTPPTVISVSPANAAKAIVMTTSLTVSFSEAMNASTITSSTFTLKEGSNSVAGAVTYSGTTATFKPSAALAGSTTYTATITTGAKDAAGNPIAAGYSWSFTTEAVAPPPPTGMSFSKDVMPVLTLCNNCHTHPWTTSTVASSYYTNLVNGGYINPNSPTSSKIYVKLSGGHPGSSISTADKNKVLNWIAEGAKNN